MSQKHASISIRGVITLTAHAHQTSPDGGSEGVTPMMKTGVVFEKKRVDVPYITGNSVRGLIRRKAGEVLTAQLAAKHEQISRNVYLSIMRGSYARTGLDAGGASWMQLFAAKNHAFVGLFGGGAHVFRSGAHMTGDLLPMITATRDMFPFRYQSECLDVQPWDLLNKTLIASRDDFERLPDGDYIENPEEAYMQHMAAKYGQNAAKKAQKAEAKAEGQAVIKSEKLKTDDLNTFTQVECLIPGTPLYFGMNIRKPTDAQTGLLLTAIQAWANENTLGGGSSRGRGSFKASLQVYHGSELLIDNLLIGDAGDYALSEKANVYLAALSKELDEGMASAALLSKLYPTLVKKEDDGAKGNAKAVAQD